MIKFEIRANIPPTYPYMVVDVAEELFQDDLELAKKLLHEGCDTLVKKVVEDYLGSSNSVKEKAKT